MKEQSFRRYILSSILLTLLVLNMATVQGQVEQTDSLLLEINKTKVDSIKYNLYEELRVLWVPKDKLEAIKYTKEQLTIAEKNNWAEKALETYRSMATLQFQTGQSATAFQTLDRGIALAQVEKDTDAESKHYAVKGSIQLIEGSYDKAKSNYEKAFELAQINNTYWLMGRAVQGVANVYNYEGEGDKAVMKYDASIRYFQKADKNNSVLGSMYNKALILAEDKPTEAIPVFISIIQKADTINPRLVTYAANALTTAYVDIGKYEEAISNGLTNLERAKKQNEETEIMLGHRVLADIYANIKDYSKAAQQIKAGKALAKKLNDAKNIRDLYQSEAGLFQDQNQYVTADSILREGLLLLKEADYLKATLMVDLSNNFIHLDQLDSAYIALNRAAPIIEKDTNSNTAFLWDSFASYYSKIEDWTNAEIYAKKVYDFAKENGMLGLTKSSSFILYKSKKANNQHPAALSYYEEYSTANDSLLNEENIRGVVSIEMNTRFEKEKELLALQEAKEKAILKAQTQQSRTVAIGIGALALLGFGFFWNARRKNNIIAAQNVAISNQNQQLEQLNQTKDQIFAIIGHDLRKPAIAFRGITKKVNHLLKKKDYDRLNALGNEIEEDALALNKLTDNLLNWALMQKNVMPYKPEAIQLSKVTEEVVRIFKNVATEKNIDLQSNIMDSLVVSADFNALHTIIRNLVDNALKYTPKGGKVTLTATDGIQGVQVQIQDTGIGIPSEQVQDIFLLQDNKSQQGTAGEKGTGLGLHLVKELVDLNKGKIKAISQVGKGSTFQVTLPSI